MPQRRDRVTVEYADARPNETFDGVAECKLRGDVLVLARWCDSGDLQMCLVAAADIHALTVTVED
jgi:hypothetical protein